MAQLDVFENPEEDSCKEVPFLLDVQHEMHSHLATRMVIPLVHAAAQKAGLNKLCPTFVIRGQKVFASTPEMSAYPAKGLRVKVDNLCDKRMEVFDAVDFLLNGF